MKDVDEENDRVRSIRNCRIVTVPDAGHWVHHDQLDVFINEARLFLAE